MSDRRRLLLPVLLWTAPLVFLGCFYFYPLVSILRLSFAAGSANPLDVLSQIATSPSLRGVVWFTIWQAALSTVITMALGLPGAYLMARYQFPGRSLVQVLISIPFVMPTIVVAAGFNALLGAQGWANQLLIAAFDLPQPPIRFMNTLLAILTAHVFYNVTIVLRMVGDFWSHIDPRLGQAATMLGAGPWQVLRQVSLPLLMPAVTAAALLVFIFDFTSFGVILIMGGPRFSTLEVEIYNQTIGMFNLPLAATLALVQLACTLALTVAYSRLTARLSLPLSLRPRTFSQRKLSAWRSRLAAGTFLGVLLTLTVAPLLALSARSVTRFGNETEAQRGQAQAGIAASGLTLDYYRELNNNRRESMFYAPPGVSIGVSLGYAAATVFLALALGMPAAFALSRSSNGGIGEKLNRILDPVLMLPLGTSAVTLGLGFVVALDHPPLDLRASPLLIPLAHTLVAFPFVVRSITPALRSIRPRLRQAAAVLGADQRQVFRYIDLPLVGRALFVAATFAFTISLGEFGATALIARPEYPTLPLAIYRLISQPGSLNYGQALALSTILMAVCAAGMLAIERFRIADIGEF